MVNLAQRIDHTLLKADATESSIEQLCLEAIKFNFFSACINPYWVPKAKEFLKGSSVKVCSVVGFPLGSLPTQLKQSECDWLISQGIDEIDMVMNIGALKSGDTETTFDDIKSVVSTCGKTPVKVIVETALLNQEEKARACELVLASGAAFIKTSTGFASAGAQLEDIALFKAIGTDVLQIKASGGIKSREFAEQLISAGASRLGTSQSIAIVSGQLQSAGDKY